MNSGEQVIRYDVEYEGERVVCVDRFASIDAARLGAMVAQKCLDEMPPSPRRIAGVDDETVIDDSHPDYTIVSAGDRFAARSKAEVRFYVTGDTIAEVTECAARALRVFERYKVHGPNVEAAAPFLEGHTIEAGWIPAETMFDTAPVVDVFPIFGDERDAVVDYVRQRIEALESVIIAKPPFASIGNPLCYRDITRLHGRSKNHEGVIRKLEKLVPSLVGRIEALEAKLAAGNGDAA